MVGKGKVAVFAIACRKVGSVVSASVRGIAVCCPTNKLGTICGKVWFGSRSGLWLSSRYRVHQLVSNVSWVRLVSRFPIKALLTPVAVLPGRVRNGSKSAGAAPLETRYALRKF